MVGYIFGGKDTPWTYEELQAKRKVADALMAQNAKTPTNVGEGLSAIGRALMYRKLDKKATAEESRLRDEFNAKWGSVLGGMDGAGGSSGGYTPSGTWTPEPPKPDAVDAMQGTMTGGLSFPNLPKANLGGGADLSFGSATMTPQEMLIEGAKARGLDPIDVATAISYETGGKFDPMMAGPTTQWGTHRGLIQFGEPQAAKYGADFSDPQAAMRSQLDPTSGAVWNYLDQTGVKPGMGLPEIYSAINAGTVGRMGASDANNGGAPGTVADKVASMGPHREKAAAFLGGTWTPSEGAVTASAMGGGQPAGGMDLGALAALASDPMASPAQKGIIEALIGQQMAAMDPMRAIELEKAQLELAQMKNPGEDTTEYDLRASEALQYGMTPGTPEYQEFVLTGNLPKAPEAARPYSTMGEIQADLANGLITQEQAQMAVDKLGGGGTSVTVNNDGSGVKPLGTEGQILVPDPNEPSGYRVELAPGSKAAMEAESAKSKKAATDEAKASGTAIASDVITTAADRALAANRERSVGGLLGSVAAFNPSSMNAELYRQVDVLTANAKVENLQAMRAESPTGGALGAVTEKETQMLADQAGALDPASPRFERDVLDYTRTLLRVIHGKDAGDAIFEQKYGDAAAALDADGWTILPNGVKIRVKP